MGKRLDQYIAYYKASMQKYEGDEDYKNSYLSNKALYEAISSCDSMEEFKEKVEKGKLHIKNAIALIKDKEKLYYKHYVRIKENIRAKKSREILEEIEKREFNTDMELVRFISEIEQKYSRLIAIDEFGIELFIGDLAKLETLDVHESAEVDEEFKAETSKYVQKEIEEAKQDYKNQILPDYRVWDNTWQMDYNAIKEEERHRRKLSIPDEVLKKRIQQHKHYRGIE